MIKLHIRQDNPVDGLYPIRLSLTRNNQLEREAEARIQFALTENERNDLRWYLEDYLHNAGDAETSIAAQVEVLMKTRGEELYRNVLQDNDSTRALWLSVRDNVADLRVEIATAVAEAASIPWELMRDPLLKSPISLRAKSFVRVQSNPNIAFLPVPNVEEGRLRILYVACRPGGADDVELRAVANRLLRDLGQARSRFDIKALRPPTFEKLEEELNDAKEAGRPYHIVHFDGHGTYQDLSDTELADWAAALQDSADGDEANKRGYLLFEHDSEVKMRPIDGEKLGKLLHDSRVPVLVLNACQSAMHDATGTLASIRSVHDEVRAIGSFSQAVVDQGIPAVLGMRYSVFVVTAAKYIGELYAELAKGRTFGQAASEGRKRLHSDPKRWVGLQPRPLQDWFVPVVYEAHPVSILEAKQEAAAGEQPELDPVQYNRALLRHVPEEGFIGRDETLVALDRAFDKHRVVLLHAYAGQGKSSTAVEFARWYSVTGGLGERPYVFFASFETHNDLNDLLNQIGQSLAPLLTSPAIDWIAENDPARRVAIVKRILRTLPILWIWDNVETVAGFPEGTESQWTPAEQAELRDFLQQITLDTLTQVRILLTSRRNEAKWLRKIPHRIEMPSMRASDAARLALKLGEERNLTRSDIGEWQPLLDYCAGNPLTLRILVAQAVRMELRRYEQVGAFIEAIRSGEQDVEDVDTNEGRDKSLAASLDYGFRNAFKEDELPIIALLHLFQGIVDVDAIYAMGVLVKYSIPELKGKTKEYLTSLLERAKEAGLLTHLRSTWYAIHPALPWFLRQLFSRYYDGVAGRTTNQLALRSWIEAIGGLSNYYTRLFAEGNRHVIDVLELEEANLIQARRLAIKNEYWRRVISCMQGLHVLYEYQGRTAEWARLVEEIRAHYCTDDDDPIPGREDEYQLVAGYRVSLARLYERDLAKAARLQEKRVRLERERSASTLALPPDTPLDDDQHSLLRSLAISIEVLGHIQRDNDERSCVESYQEAIDIFRRLNGQAEVSIVQYNLARAYTYVKAIRNLDTAEALFLRSLELHAPKDAFGRSKCLTALGVIYCERLISVRNDAELAETFKEYARKSETFLLEALEICPGKAVTDLAPIHNSLANLYSELGQLDKAREHYSLDAYYEEAAGNRFGAGQTRFNLGLMYLEVAVKAADASQRSVNLERALSYAEAALRDFQYYKGRLPEYEAKAQSLINQIKQSATALSDQ